VFCSDFRVLGFHPI
jgi:hypothetical protein